MFRKLLLALIAAATLFPTVGADPYTARVAQAAPMPTTAILYVGQNFRTGMHVYKWYYVNHASERYALDQDIAMFKAKGWAIRVKYE